VKLPILGALLIGLSLQAFTIVTDGATKPDGSPRFVDPDETAAGIANSGGQGSNIMRFGDTTLQFGTVPSSGFGTNAGAPTYYGSGRFVPPGFRPFNR